MGVAFLGSYLCISILEFKYAKLVVSGKKIAGFMYFYIRI